MKIFGHSSEKITKCYIGINEDEISETLLNFRLGFLNFLSNRNISFKLYFIARFNHYHSISSSEMNFFPLSFNSKNLLFPPPTVFL